MRNPVNVTLPFVAPAGISGSVALRHDDRCGDKAHLSIDMGRPISGVKATAPLALSDMHKLVDGLMDCIHAIERKERLDTDEKEQ